jgi:hypothetical protein
VSAENRGAAPREGFRSFLNKAEVDGWIAGARWRHSDSYVLLKNDLGPSRLADGFSRTHKKGTDGIWWACEVEAHYGTTVGLDLEILISRPILDDPTWISRRLGISRPATPKATLEEWSHREAVYKALYPGNEHLRLSQIRRSGASLYSVFTPQGESSVQVRSSWHGKWLLTLAWRSA